MGLREEEAVITTVCNACGHEQEFRPEVRKVERDIEHNFIRCGNCGKEFTAFYTNARIRKLQESQRKLLAAGLTGKSEARYAGSRGRIKEMMDALRERMEHPPGQKD